MRPRFSIALLLLMQSAALAPYVHAQRARHADAPLPIPAPRAFAHHARIRMGYDEASGYGDVELEPMPVVDSLGLAFTALFVFPGHVLHAPPAQVSIALIATGDTSRFVTPASRTLAFALDGGASSVRVGELVRALDSAGDRVRETLALRLATRDFLRVVNATRAEARLGTLIVPFGNEAMEAMRDFASRMDPSAYARALAAAQARTSAGGIDYRQAVYERNEVDSAARRVLIFGSLRIPSLTDTLTAPRLVQFEYIVDSTGHVDPSTLHGRHEDADAPFLAALREQASQWQFEPARKHGQPVAQRVREQIRFIKTNGR